MSEKAISELLENSKTCQTVISLSRQIQDHLNKDILKEGQPFIILEEYEWLREVMSLLSKQSNLFESCILLLENNMEQEAYIIARSQFNNMLWISYICNGINSNTRVKEYFYEPHITLLQQMINLKNYLKKLPKGTPQYDKYATIDLEEIDNKIKDVKAILRTEGYKVDDYKKPVKNKKIIELTEMNPLLLGLYNSFYNESSKYEHADISTTRSFRKTVSDDISADIAFKIDMSKSDIKLWKTVFNQALTTLYIAILRIQERLKNHDEHLFEFKQFNELSFSSLIINIKMATDIVDTIIE